MANNPFIAPFPIVGSTGTDARGKPTALATVNGIAYACSGDSAALAATSLAEQLLLLGCDPLCKLTCGATVIQDIIGVV